MYLIALNLLFFSACKQNPTTKSLKNDNYMAHEAKFFDIPMPLGFKLNKEGITENSYSFFIKKTVSDLISFYESEMETFGWNKFASFINFESILIFVKPNGKKISVSIRNRNNNSNESNVIIFFES